MVGQLVQLFNGIRLDNAFIVQVIEQDVESLLRVDDVLLVLCWRLGLDALHVCLKHFVNPAGPLRYVGSITRRLRALATKEPKKEHQHSRYLTAAGAGDWPVPGRESGPGGPGGGGPARGGPCGGPLEGGGATAVDAGWAGDAA